MHLDLNSQSKPAETARLMQPLLDSVPNMRLVAWLGLLYAVGVFAFGAIAFTSTIARQPTAVVHLSVAGTLVIAGIVYARAFLLLKQGSAALRRYTQEGSLETIQSGLQTLKNFWTWAALSLIMAVAAALVGSFVEVIFMHSRG